MKFPGESMKSGMFSLGGAFLDGGEEDMGVLDINDLIKAEKEQGRAKHVLRFPRWIVVCGYYCIKLVFGNSNKTYLVFKALWPFRTSE